MKHRLGIRVYYEDTDAGGIVYNANYLKFAERGRTEFLRETGFQNSDVRKQHNCMFVLRRAEVDYLHPARLDDLLCLETAISNLKSSSFTMHQCVKKDDNVVADMHVVLVCVDVQSYKPVRLPLDIKTAFQSYLENVE